ncbi:MAG: Gfo/Idh/MocA family oxidoreductase [Victivallales bacterium]|nr:Gfo/Idh/MocA family oxidoreductase [Victivallales bacterium]
MERINVGFIGCGGIAQYHFSHFDKMLDKARIAAACDLIPERAQKTAERYPGANVYTDYREMFEKEKLDAVYICVQPGAHDGMEFIAIDKGINIFCQKPMTLDMNYAKKVLAGIKRKKLISAVGLQCRYSDSWDFIKQFIGRKIAANDLAMVSAYRIGGFPMVWWWRRFEQSGGQAVEQTIHNFDMLRWIFGEVKQVCSVRRRGVIRDIPDHNADDASSTLITFKNGVIGTFNTGCFGGSEGDTTAYYRNGNIKYSLFGNYTITEPNRTVTGKPMNDAGQECDETFVDAVRGDIDREEILSPYADAIKTLAFVFAINKSMDANGAPVVPEC